MAKECFLHPKICNTNLLISPKKLIFEKLLHIHTHTNTLSSITVRIKTNKQKIKILYFIPIFIAIKTKTKLKIVFWLQLAQAIKLDQGF